MTKDIELRLVDALTPSGEVAAKDLAALATALQELTTRISRDVINTPGPGRTKQFVEELSQLRLRAIEASSTVLRFSKGPTDKLDVDLPEQTLADDRFWEIVGAMREDRRPDWVTDLIAESVGKLVNAFQAAAPTVILKHVQSDITAAQLVGQWVIARGEAAVLESGRLVALDNASVSAVDDPAAEHMGGSVTTLDEILASAPGPDIDGGIDLSDDEFEAFLKAARS